MRNLPQVIGFAGPARVGKDTAADYVASVRPYQKTSFARPIKIMLMAGLGLTHDQVYGELKDEWDARYDCTPRHMMQTLGTDWGRNMICSDLWLRAMASTLSGSLAVIPDVRFNDEAQFIRRHGLLIHLSGRGGIDGAHASEAGVRKHPHDAIIYNTSGIEQLHRALDAALSNWSEA